MLGAVGTKDNPLGWKKYVRSKRLFRGLLVKLSYFLIISIFSGEWSTLLEKHAFFERSRSLRRDVLGKVRKKGDPSLASQNEWSQAGNQWHDRCCSQITLTPNRDVCFSYSYGKGQPERLCAAWPLLPAVWLLVGLVSVYSTLPISSQGIHLLRKPYSHVLGQSVHQSRSKVSLAWF